MRGLRGRGGRNRRVRGALCSVTAVAGKTPSPHHGRGTFWLLVTRVRRAPGRRCRPERGEALVEREAGRGEGERGDTGRRIGLHPVGDPVHRAEQRRLVDQVVRNGGRGALLVAGQVLVLDLGGFLLVPHALGELVVEVLLTAAHAAHVQGGVRPEGVGERRHVLVVADGDRQRRADVEPFEGLAGLLAPRAQVLDGGVLDVRGGREDEQRPVGDLTGLFEVLGADGGDVERDVLALGVHGQLDGLARAAGQRQRPVLAVVGEPLTAHRLAYDLHVLAGTGERLVELDAVPALGDLRPGDAETEPEAAAGERVEGGGGHRGHRGLTGRNLEDGRADVDTLGLGGDPGEHCGRVRPVGLGGPADGVSEPVGLLRHGQIVRVHSGTPVAEVDPELHGRFPLPISNVPCATDTSASAPRRRWGVDLAGPEFRSLGAAPQTPLSR